VCQLRKNNKEYIEMERRINDTEMKLVGLPDRNKTIKERMLETEYINRLNDLRQQTKQMIKNQMKALNKYDTNPSPLPCETPDFTSFKEEKQCDRITEKAVLKWGLDSSPMRKRSSLKEKQPTHHMSKVKTTEAQVRKRVSESSIDDNSISRVEDVSQERR